MFFVVCKDAPKHVFTKQLLFHHQFLRHDGTILLNDIDEIDALVPIGGVDVDDFAALLLADLLSDEVIHLHLGHIRAFHGELARGRIGLKFGFGGKFGDGQKVFIDINTNLKLTIT